MRKWLLILIVISLHAGGNLSKILTEEEQGDVILEKLVKSNISINGTGKSDNLFDILIAFSYYRKKVKDQANLLRETEENLFKL